MKNYNYPNVSADALRKLQNAQKRREEKYKNLRCVYAYYQRKEKEYTDNLILVPFANKEAHKMFLTSIVCNLLRSVSEEFGIERVEQYKNFEIHYIGDFEKDTMTFDKIKSPRSIIKFSDYIPKNLKEIKEIK